MLSGATVATTILEMVAPIVVDKSINTLTSLTLYSMERIAINYTSA
jgi:hypothetical protein